MSTNHPTRPAPSASSPNQTEGMKAPHATGLPRAAHHAYGVHRQGPLELPPMPIYLGAQNTPTASPTAEAERGQPGPEAQAQAQAQAYNPTELAKALLALLGILLGLTLALGGWQPHTSEARLGWSAGTIRVVPGTDGDTGSRPLSPADAGVRPAPDNLPPMSSSLSTKMSSSLDTPSRPVEMPKTFFEGSGPGGVSVNPPPSGSQA